MRSRRTVLSGLASASIITLAGCTGSDGGDGMDPMGADQPAGANGASSIDVQSGAVEDDTTVPARYTCDGADVSPPLTPQLPDGTATWALTVTDPDAPGGTFTHWIIWNIPAERSLPEDVPHGETVSELEDARQGTNDFGDVGYGGPCPPEGDDPHTYAFTVYALEEALSVPAGAERDELEGGIEASDALLGLGTIQATYDR